MCLCPTLGRRCWGCVGGGGGKVEVVGDSLSAWCCSLWCEVDAEEDIRSGEPTRGERRAEATRSRLAVLVVD